MPLCQSTLSLTTALVIGAQSAAAQATTEAVPRSAPISDVRYEVTFDPFTATSRSYRVAMSFMAGGTAPVTLSLPAWTPGAYEISDFARYVTNFTATQNGTSLDWDKVDHDTWRIGRGRGGGRVTVTFAFRADTLDNGMSWSRDDFLLFNGSNVFMYPEGRGFDFPATVTFRTVPEWRVATGMQALAPNTFRENNYHDLVDMPFFVGAFDLDSAIVAGKWMRLATYPAGAVQGARRNRIWSQLKAMTPPQAAVFGDIPWRDYTVMQISDSGYGGVSGLEHQNSHVVIVSARALDDPFMTSLYSHEIFHAWNVKRLRPAELFPYRYDVRQPTPMLWVSEGITDYYADVAMLRGGLADSSDFLETAQAKIAEFESQPVTALEDASLSTWVRPADGTHYQYYDKGSVAGLLLDILIRDASDNRGSLDSVMRDLYNATWKRGRGFTNDEWWSAVARAAGGTSFDDFRQRYVDGRESFPYSSVFPLAGVRVAADSIGMPLIGAYLGEDSTGVLVTALQSGSSAAEAGVQPGDYLLAVGDVGVTDLRSVAAFRERYARARADSPLVYRVRRAGREVALRGRLRQNILVRRQLSYDAGASPRALRVRAGLLRGTTRP